ncbi:hypothetical protein BJY01DRAFT_219645 [Aspergillus pseudoustus]|uniref:Uncharacterized protein n=1 Tax=Aspergillus pseudoustus TaxID=1810923 RepID=A0ABR4JH37_9EURO
MVRRCMIFRKSQYTESHSGVMKWRLQLAVLHYFCIFLAIRPRLCFFYSINSLIASCCFFAL